MYDISQFLTVTPDAKVRRATPPSETREAVRARVQKHRANNKNANALERLVILDFETDPFNNVERGMIFPFLCVLYSRTMDPVVIWDEDFDRFLGKLFVQLNLLPEGRLIYAHNGGKFDYLFIMSRLRGEVMFKGRGMMQAYVPCGDGRQEHEMRDSMHLIPERLAAIQKDDFDYAWMHKSKRRSKKQEIIDYCINDCKFLLDIVENVIRKEGLKLSIGQIAFSNLKKMSGKDEQIKPISIGTDDKLRPYFYGGRVECIKGAGYFSGAYKLYDVNSMYPFVMANYRHPVGRNYFHRTGLPGRNTAFLRLTCKNNGALPIRDQGGTTRFDSERGGTWYNGEFQEGFLCTIHEFRTARELGLISEVKILECIDCDEFATFDKFVIPLYNERIKTKQKMSDMVRDGLKGSPEWFEIARQDQLLKLTLNNAYGKTAQNPRKFKNYYVCDIDGTPPIEGCDAKYGGPMKTGGWERDEQIHEPFRYSIWKRPSYDLSKQNDPDLPIGERMRFNNVGTGASITGAARSVLLRAIHSAIDPIYCDTDSLVCRSLGGHTLDATALGAWDLEAEFDEVIIAGKKTYACRNKGMLHGQKDSYKIRSKGADNSELVWRDFIDMLEGKSIEVVPKAPTLFRNGLQKYQPRNIRVTAPILDPALLIVPKIELDHVQ